MATETRTIKAHEVLPGDMIPGYGWNPIVTIEIHWADWRFILEDGTRLFWEENLPVTVNRPIPITNVVW